MDSNQSGAVGGITLGIFFSLDTYSDPMWGAAGKGTERLADKLEAEYERTLRDLDVRLLGAAPARAGHRDPPPGPLLSRLRALGRLEQGKLVAGPLRGFVT